MCIPIAIAMTLIAGVILGAPTLRLRGDYLAIVTLGFGEIIRIVARNLDDVTNGADRHQRRPGAARPGDRRTAFFNTIDAERWYWLALVVLILMIFLARRLENSRVGRAWLAIREDEDAAAIMGVPPSSSSCGPSPSAPPWAASPACSSPASSSTSTRTPSCSTSRSCSWPWWSSAARATCSASLLGAFLLTYLPERFREFQD